MLHDLFAILRWVPLALSAAVVLYWCVFLYRLVRSMVLIPRISAGLRTTIDSPARVTIIIPAHNEENVIARCAKSLVKQDYPDVEIIFVLDRCTDHTRARLEAAIDSDPRVTIIENDACPDDWAGKCHAAHLGAERATGQWLLFTDADTEFAPTLVRAAVGLAHARGLQLLSILSTLSTDRWFQRIVQPVAALQLLGMYPLDRVNDPTTKRTFANGQFMLFDRAHYERIGGHTAVKDDLLEDIAFARRTVRNEGRVGVFVDDGLLHCDMYDTFEDFNAGWMRIFAEACKRRSNRLRKQALRLALVAWADPAVRAVTLLCALFAWFAGDQSWAVLAAVAVIIGTTVRWFALGCVYRMAGAPLWAVAMYHRGALHVWRILRTAAKTIDAREPFQWAGRTYVLEPGSTH